MALLDLEEPLPGGVTAAPLKSPLPADLVGKRWWAFGFADGDPLGNSADGLVGAALAFGWIRLDAESRYHVEPGFSGGGIWSPDYQAVVGLVGQANARGDGRAITLHQADQLLPGEKLGALAAWSAAEAGELALAAWGWALEGDPEAGRHWRPRARGVSGDNERGYRFRGRTAALTAIVSWLDRPDPDRGVLVVTGSPGVGKSAVLGRIVTTADAYVRTLLPPDDDAVRATQGSVSCAVHAKGKTALEVATEIARAASAALPAEVGDLAPALRTALEARGGQRFNVIIDALDEAATPAEARSIIDKIVLPLAETYSDVGAQAVVGSRRRDDKGDLLSGFGPGMTAVDLDDPSYFSEADLAAYALACLQRHGDERAGNPYADSAVAQPVAAQIARLADRNFLVAGLIARAHGLHDRQAIAPGDLEFTVSVAAALSEYLECVSPVAGVSARDALTALAFAEAPGLPVKLWRQAIQALCGKQVAPGPLAWFARSSAANFLVESGSDGGGKVFRLFHQALNDVLLDARAESAVRADDERALSRSFAELGRAGGWASAPEYLLRSLGLHAARGGGIDELLTDDAYLLYADLRRLIPLSDLAESPAAERRARLLRLTPEAITADPRTRAALFSVTEALDGLGHAYAAACENSAYRALWAAASPRTERAALAGHQGKVWAICAVTVSGQELLASAGNDHPEVRIWNLATGEPEVMLTGHQGGVLALCSFALGDRTLIASAGSDSTVRIWDPATGQQQAVLTGHRGWIWGICTLTVGGRVRLASASDDATVRIWDPATGQQQAVLTGHHGGVNGVCAFTQDGQVRLASAGDDRTVRIWDPATGAQQAVLTGHSGWVRKVCAFTAGGQPWLASASDDAQLLIWNPVSGTAQRVLAGHQGAIIGVCAVPASGRTLLASASHDRTVRIWDPATGQPQVVLTGHQSSVNDVSALIMEDRAMLASASHDGTVRIWDLATSQQQAGGSGHQRPVNGVGQLILDGQAFLATASHDGTVRIWDAATGAQHAVCTGHEGRVNAVCEFTLGGRTLLASASHDRSVRIWDPATGQQQAVLTGHDNLVRGICSFTMDGQVSLASSSDDGTIRLWDPGTGELWAMLYAHRGVATGVCAFTLDGRLHLASSSDDRMVRIWDPATGQRTATLSGHQGAVNGVCAFSLGGRALLASASDDDTARIWDAATGKLRAVLAGHRAGVEAVSRLTLDGRVLLVSAGQDATVRIWDPGSLACLLTVPTQHAARAVAQVGDCVAVGLYAGVLMIKPQLT